MFKVLAGVAEDGAPVNNPIQERDAEIQRARELKARKICDEVIRQAIETLRGLDDGEWFTLTDHAGALSATARKEGKGPSEESKEIVYRMLKGRTS